MASENLPAGTKLVTMADYVMDLTESPAQFERKHSKELMDLYMLINFYSSVIARCTDDITNGDLDHDDLVLCWDRRKKETFALPALYKKYDALVAKLDLAVHNELTGV